MHTYVIHVEGGKERGACRAVLSVASDVVDDCFVPEIEVKKKIKGEWTCNRELMFPGYVFVRTASIEDVRKRLRGVSSYARLLRDGEGSPIPLTADEVAWLDASMGRDSHVLEMSEGVIEGDNVIVTSGPLKGHEANIKKVDRHKRLAWMDVYMLGRTKTVRVGLEIVAKR